MPKISFDGGAFELEDVQENPARYVARLERAKITPGFALCLCVTPPRQLVVRRYGRLLHLAGWPEDGHTHRSSCPFQGRRRSEGFGRRQPGCYRRIGRWS
jgi:hypothetical protein